MNKEEIQFILSIIGAIFSIGILGYLIKLFSLVHKIAKDKQEILEQRIKLKDDKVDLIQTEKIGIINERDKLKEKLQNILDKEGLTVSQISTNKISEVEQKIGLKIDVLVEQMEVLQNQLNNSDDNYDYNLSVGEAFYSKNNWEKAAFHFEKATKINDSDWQVCFSKAIAYANLRKDRLSDEMAMKSYYQTISVIPENIDKNIKGRVYIYLGAMLKRLNKLDEAEINLVYGLTLPISNYEIVDGKYNLACIYGMKKQKQKMLDTIQEMKKIDKSYIRAIQYHLEDYFKFFSNDEEFLKLLAE
ncbi:MAG: hypothetical protein GXO79_04170 [Chlorobi bacterium]|nr:hypothetical protein [Chlorobiota bacterium]